MTDERSPSEHEAPRAVCPYCGTIGVEGLACADCGGRIDALSKQATQNSMGPWGLRDESNPFRPGCSFETLCRMIERGTVTADSIIRGPTTNQFWCRASAVPGIANRLGMCHACGEPAGRDQFACRACGAAFTIDRDRQHLGLVASRFMPGQTAEARVVASAEAPAAAPIPEPIAEPLPKADPDVDAKPAPGATGGARSSDAPQPRQPGSSVPSDQPGRVESLERQLRRSRAEARQARAVSWVAGMTAAILGLALLVWVIGGMLGEPGSSPESAEPSPPVDSRGPAVGSGDPPGSWGVGQPERAAVPERVAREPVEGVEGALAASGVRINPAPRELEVTGRVAGPAEDPWSEIASLLVRDTPASIATARDLVRRLEAEGLEGDRTSRAILVLDMRRAELAADWLP